MKPDTQDVKDIETKRCYTAETEGTEADVFSQVEISHGSISNQPSMYQASTEESADYRRSKVFCCDLLFVMFLFVGSVFLILFSYDHIPSLDAFFKDHPHEKDLVLALACVVIGIVFFVFLFRCCRRTWCHETLRKRNARKFYNRFKDSKSENLDVNNQPTRTPSFDNDNDWTPKLSELSESQLEKVKNIFSRFLAYHDGNDWLFSPSTVSAISRRGGFTENEKFQRVKESVRIKFVVKLILVGQANVGKTSIFHRILYDRFSEYYMATLGADLAHVCLHVYPENSVDHVMVNLQLWDIAGSERFSELSHIVYKDATAFIVICDITSADYVTQAEPWVKDITQLKFDPYVALFYNKIDLNGTESRTACHSSAGGLSCGLDAYSVSAKTGEMVLGNVIEVLVKSVIHEIDKLL